jgi:isopentenyldiphosphate isomerase
VPQDDPKELFDLYDEAGRPLGVSKARALVHRDGDWHKSVHVWVVLVGAAAPAIVLQRRGLAKDSHPGAVDVSVAGHLHAGESVDAAIREAHEEIGLALEAKDLVPLGTRRKSDASGGRRDREIQDIFCVTVARAFETLRPDPDEVAGVLTVALSDARALFDGDVLAVSAREIRAGASHADTIVLRRDEVLRGGEGYFAAVLRTIARRLAGESVELETWD